MEKKKKQEKIFKTFRSIVKKIGKGEDEGIIDVLIPMSTGSTDRHGESIDPKSWKKTLKEFKKRSILLSSHNYGSIQNQIGEFTDVQVTEEGLLAKPKYYINQGNPEADWAYFIASKGMAAYSVGFIPIKWVDAKDEPFRTYTENELIEISHVTVPSNRDAIMGLQAKGIDDPVILKIVDEVLEDSKDNEYYFPKEGEPRDIKIKVEGDTEEFITEGTNEKGAEVIPIDPDKVIASIEGETLTEIKEFNINEIYEVVKENKALKEKIADLELKAGAVLNTKNKSNLKDAQELIQSVLDSAGKEESIDEGGETKDDKKDSTVITITEDKKEDPGKDEEPDKKTITVDEKLIAEAVSKALKYQMGIVVKSNTKLKWKEVIYNGNDRISISRND